VPGEDVVVVTFSLVLHVVQDRKGLPRQRHPMLDARLHSRHRNRPDLCFEIELVKLSAIFAASLTASRLFQSNDVAFFIRLAASRPRFHERPALFECVTTTIGLFGLVPDHMRERGLRDFPREMRFVARPIAERAAKAVDGHPFNAEPRQNLGHCHVREGTRAAWARKDKLASARLRKPFEGGPRMMR
jgi:hypothetical protein